MTVILWWTRRVIVQCGSFFSSARFGTANTGGAIPRPKNAPPARFLNGLSIPFSQSRKMHRHPQGCRCFLVDSKGLDPSNLTDATRALSQLSYEPELRTLLILAQNRAVVKRFPKNFLSFQNSAVTVVCPRDGIFPRQIQIAGGAFAHKTHGGAVVARAHNDVRARGGRLVGKVSRGVVNRAYNSLAASRASMRHSRIMAKSEVLPYKVAPA